MAITPGNLEELQRASIRERVDRAEKQIDAQLVNAYVWQSGERRVVLDFWPSRSVRDEITKLYQNYGWEVAFLDRTSNISTGSEQVVSLTPLTWALG